ncbi:MAG: hypothetical protein K8R58_13120, partial [Bacteroidales bacterium]|nr:hypothetical protein [Bacteroidales bacterium]
KKLNNDAIISISLMSTANYISDEARQINSVLYNTLKKVFKNILIIPGNKNYYLASDNELDSNITRMIEKKGIDNIYVNQYYIDDQLLKNRSNYILNSLDKENVVINKDFMPVSYYQQLQYWLRYFKFNIWILILIILILLFIILLRLKPINLGLFSGGFAASSIEVLLLISFQIIYGYVYQMTGIIITIFMTGLAIGALFYNKILKAVNIKTFIKIQFTIGIYSIILPFLLLAINSIRINSIIVHLIFFLLTIIIAIVVGMQFSVASKIQSQKVSSIAAGAYSSDLLGSAIGALLVTTVLLPLFGIVKVSIFIGLLNFITGFIILLKQKKYILLS